MRNLEIIVLKSLSLKPKNLKSIHQETQISYENLGLILSKLKKEKRISDHENSFFLNQQEDLEFSNLDLEYRQFVNTESIPYSFHAALDDSDKETLNDILRNLKQFLNYCHKKNKNHPIKDHTYFYLGKIPLVEISSRF